MAVAAGLASPAPAGTSGTVWLEILPVFLCGTAIWSLRPRGGRSWRVPYGGDVEVHRAVLRHLASAGVEAAAVHSTSWRQERGAVVLTHLAAIGPPARRVEGFEQRPVRRLELARGTALSPPRRIGSGHVIAHALRHLAWLVAQDQAVSRALGPAWQGALHPYRPEPFQVFGEDAAPPSAGR